MLRAFPVFSTGIDNPAGPVSVDGRGGFVTRPAFKGNDISRNGSARSDPFLHPSKGGLQTRPYPNNTNNRCEYRLSLKAIASEPGQPTQATVVPAKAGIQEIPGKERAGYREFWIPAFAGTTGLCCDCPAMRKGVGYINDCWHYIRGRGGFVTRPTVNGKHRPANRWVILSPERRFQEWRVYAAIALGFSSG